jgi:hypothetical protein
MRSHLLAACAAFAAALASGATAVAQPAPSPAASPAATAVPTASPTPSAPSDPCVTILAIVNRPTIGTGVCPVQPGHVMIENGYTNTVSSGPNGAATASYPQTLIRAGTVVPHLEISVTPPSEFRAGGATGYSDITVGAKYELGYGARWVYGVNAVVSEPTGSSAYTAGGSSYTGNFNWGYTINSEFALSGTLGFNAFAAGFGSTGSLQHYSAFIPTLEATAALPASSQAFAEAAYFSKAGYGQPGRWYYDFGLQKDLSKKVQVDVEYGFSPTSILGQTQQYVGAGVSFYLGP